MLFRSPQNPKTPSNKYIINWKSFWLFADHFDLLGRAFLFSLSYSSLHVLFHVELECALYIFSVVSQLLVLLAAHGVNFLLWELAHIGNQKTLAFFLGLTGRKMLGHLLGPELLDRDAAPLARTLRFAYVEKTV